MHSWLARRWPRSMPQPALKIAQASAMIWSGLAYVFQVRSTAAGSNTQPWNPTLYTAKRTLETAKQRGVVEGVHALLARHGLTAQHVATRARAPRCEMHIHAEA